MKASEQKYCNPLVKGSEQTGIVHKQWRSQELAILLKMLLGSSPQQSQPSPTTMQREKYGMCTTHHTGHSSAGNSSWPKWQGPLCGIKGAANHTAGSTLPPSSSATPEEQTLRITGSTVVTCSSLFFPLFLLSCSSVF